MAQEEPKEEQTAEEAAGKDTPPTEGSEDGTKTTKPTHTLSSKEHFKATKAARSGK